MTSTADAPGGNPMLVDLFWRSWTSEYLPTSLERKKWNTPRRNLAVGDLVFLAD